MGVRALIAVVLCIVLLVRGHGTALGSALGSRELGLVDIPSCGILCMLSTVPATGCSLNDLECVCSNEKLAYTLSACMLANCTMADTSSTARVQADLCNLSEESKRTELFLYTGIVYFLSCFFVVLRIAGKFVSKRLALDDYIVVAALLMAAVPLGCVLAMTRMGFGEHVWNLEDGTLLPILRFFLISSSTYVIVLGLIKVSLVLFYLEIFKTRRFVISAYVVLGYIVINTIIIFFMTVFTCKPIEFFWNRDIKGKCLDLQGLAYANSASAILQDVILLILPLVFIRNLQMRRYRKLAVGLMFTIGAFGCIATIIRLQTLLSFKFSIDPTWDYVPVTIWTEVELAVGLVCVSLPSIRILVVKILPVSFKAFFSQITHPSSKGNSVQKRATTSQPREWKKPSDWINISQDFDENKNVSRKSFMSRLWTPKSDVRTGSRRLGSAMSNYRESGVAVTRPPYNERKKASYTHEPIELLHIPKSSANGSCAGDSSTALPEIGCLPERNFSDLDLPKKSWAAD